MILVLDYGSQYTQLIARKIRQQKVYSEIISCYTPLHEILACNPDGIVLSGGPSSVYTKNAPHIARKLFDHGIPILGICYGLQLMAYLFEGHVARSKAREYGRARITIKKADPLFDKVPKQSAVWMSHGDRLTAPPQNYTVLAASSNSPYAAIKHKSKSIYGIQFHPEVHHTEFGDKILYNFARKICGARPDWKMGKFVEHTVDELREFVGKRRVLCAVSGGVDSTVLSTLLNRAIESRLKCVFVDNGLLRMQEVKTVVSRFKKHGINVKLIDAADYFLEKLKGVKSPERKRQIIGREFINVFFREIGKNDLLAQGTLYPDVIETISTRGPSATIKTHHNRVKEVLDLMKQRRVVEPLKELFKDEVRAVGKELGLPKDVLWRQPFPGPGLAVRIIGSITRERLDLLRRADWILIEEIKRAKLYHKIWQTFSVLLPIKSVGVMGDERTYANALAIRAVHSVDGMTADWVRLPYDLMAHISNRIINEVEGINRVVYDISSKPPSTIEWE